MQVHHDILKRLVFLRTCPIRTLSSKNKIELWRLMMIGRYHNVMYMCYISWTFKKNYKGPTKIVKKPINIKAQNM